MFLLLSRYITVGRSFFSPPDGDSRIQLGHGREVWFGYHQSLRPSQWKMMVNLDICLSAFYKPQPIVDYLCEVLDKDFKARERRELFDYERLKFAKEVKGKGSFEYNGWIYTSNFHLKSTAPWISKWWYWKMSSFIANFHIQNFSIWNGTYFQDFDKKGEADDDDRGAIHWFFFVHLPWNHKKITNKITKSQEKSHTKSTKNHKSLKNYWTITRKNH